ncbi:MAG: c-type cytochrome [Rhodospirillaceae bacterium]|nr:c-type cytochrome [Rhodospirillaceae bacterium]
MPAGSSAPPAALAPPPAAASGYAGAVPADKLLQVRVGRNYPGLTAIDPDIDNPYADDPAAVQRGMQDFIAFNCVGCHAPNGGGGEGPALSNAKWIYGSSPANIYLTIVQGRPNGMPAFGAMLPDSAVWELVAYIRSIAEKTDGRKGSTISREPQSPAVEQAPAETTKTTTPWAYTQPFGNGNKP